MKPLTVLFAPGTSGTYLTWVIQSILYQTGPGVSVSVDGSAHDLRYKSLISNLISQTHYLNQVNTDYVVCVRPDQDHALDYIDNEFEKACHWDLTWMLDLNIGEDKLVKEVNHGYGTNYDCITDVPQWVLREYISFWIDDWLNDWIDFNKYSIKHGVVVDATDILQNLDQVIKDVAKYLDVSYNSPDLGVHREYANKQKHWNKQLDCIQWVNDVVNNVDAEYPGTTIFDEAYVQSLLRTQGYEIKCTELNQFPANTQEMKELIYETSTNSN